MKREESSVEKCLKKTAKRIISYRFEKFHVGRITRPKVQNLTRAVNYLPGSNSNSNFRPTSIDQELISGRTVDRITRHQSTPAKTGGDSLPEWSQPFTDNLRLNHREETPRRIENQKFLPWRRDPAPHCSKGEEHT